jgi:predicted 2-oxoglutarate/Fe(II)-dependent dioxygenase YbiX
MAVVTSARERLAALVGDLGVPGGFSARRSAPPDDLRIEVRGVGSLRLPVTAAQARALRAVARPARYGQGERTLLDPRVRDTWEIPKSRVRIDQRRWNKTLLPVLDRQRADLGIPAGCRLRAELASMLVYAPGQFFSPHQDSEKGRDMLATLVVMLPGSSRGGSLVVEHAGQQASYRSSPKLLSFVAFYADCRHEVRPLTSGHRVVLTYNLRLAGDTVDAASTLPAVAGAAGQLAGCLDGHFQPGSTSRLVYLLDHQYTAHALSWTRLKGADAARVAGLRAAAARADCAAALALAEVHQTWECDDPDWEPAPRWQRDDGDDEPDDEDALGAEGYVLGELLDSETRLTRWIVDEPGAAVEPIAAPISDTEVCATTPSVDLTPAESAYEGYMGNYGNTMDHWYRRGAVALWPRRHTFRVRAEASPGWALNALSTSLGDGDISQTRQMAAELAPFWDRVARPTPPWERPDEDGEQDREQLAQALNVAAGLDDPVLASALLARPIASLLEAAAGIDATDLRDTALDVLRAGDDTLLRWPVQVQRATATTQATARAAARLDTLAGHASQRLQASLEKPARSPDDYSITAPSGCACPLFDTLAAFLVDPVQRTLEWPLAQKRRQHIHERIDAHELPVRHQTRRVGRPYTLVLTKTAELFDREARTRREDHDDLTWLREHTP